MVVVRLVRVIHDSPAPWTREDVAELRNTLCSNPVSVTKRTRSFDIGEFVLRFDSEEDAKRTTCSSETFIFMKVYRLRRRRRREPAKGAQAAKGAQSGEGSNKRSTGGKGGAMSAKAAKGATRTLRRWSKRQLDGRHSSATGHE